MMSLENSPLWQRFHEPIIAIIITTFLYMVYLVLDIVFHWPTFGPISNQTDISADVYQFYWGIIEQAAIGILLLSLFSTLLASFFAITNERLSMPIRLLACAANVNKFFSILIYSSSIMCDLNASWLQCPPDVHNTTNLLSSLALEYGLSDMAQYCQFMLSMSRFLAVSFSGTFFRHTQRWPFAQLLVPYLLRVIIQAAFYPFAPIFGTQAYWVKGYVASFPYFLTCGLDFVTNYNMKHRRKNGTSRAEKLLMIEMIASSSFTVINYIIVDILSILVELFFGQNALNLLMTCTDLTWALFFHLGLSLISCLCFRKRKEKPARVISITQTPKSLIGHQ